MNGVARRLPVNRLLAVFGLGVLAGVLAVHLGLCLVAHHDHGPERMESAPTGTLASVVDMPDRQGGEHPHDGGADCCDEVAVRSAGPAVLLAALLALVAIALAATGEDVRGVFQLTLGASPPPRDRLPVTSRLSTLLCVYRT